MSQHAANLGRAGRLLKRIADIGGPDEFEGVPVRDLVIDVLLAQNLAYMDAAMNRTFACSDIDESAGMAEGRLIELQSYSRRVPSA